MNEKKKYYDSDDFVYIDKYYDKTGVCWNKVNGKIYNVIEGSIKYYYFNVKIQKKNDVKTLWHRTNEIFEIDNISCTIGDFISEIKRNCFIILGL